MPESFCQVADNRRRISLIEGRFLGASYKAERDAAPARGFAIRSRAASGIIHAGTTAGAGDAVPGLGQERAGNARLDRVPGSMAWS